MLFVTFWCSVRFLKNTCGLFTKKVKNCIILKKMKAVKVEETMSLKKRMWNLVFEYSQTSTIAGFHYIFEPKLTIIGKLIWLLLLSLFTVLGIYLSAENYIQWKNEPSHYHFDINWSAYFTNILRAAFTHRSQKRKKDG